MKKLLCSITLLSAIFSFSQNTRGLISDLSSQTGRSLFLRPVITDPTIQKYYISTEFRTAYVEGFERPQKYRYNGFTDNFEFLEKNEVLNLAKTPFMKLTFAENQSVFQNLPYRDDKGIDRERFLEIIIDNPSKYSLYKSFEVKEVTNDDINGYKSVDRMKIVVERDFFIGYNGQINELPKSAKKLNKILSSNVDEIIKVNKINLRKQEDIIKFIELLNK